ncbi:hypothetical protein DENSPDRAFT_763011, partial [Dentipellis sp. KUC8613]
MFEVIKGVFSRNQEYLDGDATMIEKARKLMVQIVNALTVKLEIGGPLASLYLLGHPDHFTNYSFKTFFWVSFVNEARTISPIEDYTFRPQQYEDMSLYDWIRRATKYKIPKARINQNQDDDDPDTDSYSTDDSTLIAGDEDDSDYQDYATDDDADDDSIAPSKKRKRKEHPKFLAEHPQQETHSIRICSEAKAKIPNFIGKLPRPDQGNHEDYCLTMLTLFKPWRSGLDLKNTDQTWENSLKTFTFTKRQQDIMRFANIRHECYDAHHDFQAQRIKAGRDKGLKYFGGQFVDELVKQNTQDEEIFKQGVADHIANGFDPVNMSNKTFKHTMEMAQIESVIDSAGWLAP